MANTVGIFDFEIDIHGAVVIARQERLFAGCVTEGEIDTNIALLKQDLDAVATRMKAALREQAKKPILKR